MYAIKLGLKTASEKKAGGTSRLTVSGAQRKQIDEANKAKRAREDENGSGEEMEDDSDEEEGDAAGEPSRKKGKKSVEQDDGEFARCRTSDGVGIIDTAVRRRCYGGGRL